MGYISKWAADHDDTIDSDFTEDNELQNIPPGAIRVARVLERLDRFSDALWPFGLALGWAILFVPCSAVVLVAFVSGFENSDMFWVAAIFSFGSLLTGWPLYRLIKRGIDIVRQPYRF